MRWPWSKKPAPEPHPLDPHGDGTLRPGDPIFDAAMRGYGVVGVVNPDGTWELEEFEA